MPRMETRAVGALTIMKLVPVSPAPMSTSHIPLVWDISALMSTRPEAIISEPSAMVTLAEALTS